MGPQYLVQPYEKIDLAQHAPHSFPDVTSPFITLVLLPSLNYTDGGQ